MEKSRYLASPFSIMGKDVATVKNTRGGGDHRIAAGGVKEEKAGQTTKKSYCRCRTRVEIGLLSGAHHIDSGLITFSHTKNA